MRAQVLEAFNEPYRLRELPPHKSPDRQDILIRVLAASYCHTDAELASGNRAPDLPRIGSHEFAGEIVEIGPEVNPDYRLRVGTLVGVPARAYRPCGSCHECQNTGGDPDGFGVFCGKAKALGITADGGFQDYCLVDSRQVALVPHGFSPVDTAPLMCAGLTVWNALLRAGVELREHGGLGKTVAIVGAGGGLGHLGMQFAAKMGCNIVAVDAADEPLKLIRKIVSELGQDGQLVTVVDARSEKAEEVRNQICGWPEKGLEGEKGVDGVLLLPQSQAAFDFGMKLLKDHSTCVVVSYPQSGFHINAWDLVYRDIRIIGSLVGRIRQLQDMLEFAAKHQIKAHTKIYSLDKLNELVEDYHKGVGGKLVVDMTL